MSVPEFKFLRQNVFEDDKPSEQKPRKKKSDQKAEAEQEKADSERKVLKAISDRFAQLKGFSCSISDRDKNGTTLKIRDNNTKTVYIVTAAFDSVFTGDGGREVVIKLSMEGHAITLEVNANSTRDVKNAANMFFDHIQDNSSEVEESGDAQAVADRLKSEGFGQRVQFSKGHLPMTYYGEVYIENQSTYRLILRSNKGVSGTSLNIKATNDLEADVAFAWKRWAKVCDVAIDALGFRGKPGETELTKLGRKPNAVEVTNEAILGTYRRDAIKFLDNYAEENQLLVTWKSKDDLFRAAKPLFAAILANEEGEIPVLWVHPEIGQFKSLTKPKKDIIGLDTWVWFKVDGKQVKGLPKAEDIKTEGSPPNSIDRKDLEVPGLKDDIISGLNKKKKDN
jgi:hypothetical protein